MANITSFTSVGTTSWTAPSGVTNVTYLVVGGGAGGGNAFNRGTGGGGGGGMVLTGTLSVTPGNSYTITVGGGGAGGDSGGATSGVSGANGTSSVFGNITALGGRFGQHRDLYSPTAEFTGGIA